MARARLSIRLLLLVAALLAALPLHLLWRLPRLASPWPRLLLAAVARIVGARPRVVGTPLLPFKPALLAALDPPPPGIVVQPVRIDYGAATHDLAWIGDEGGVHHARRVLARRGTFRPTLRFLEPFAPAAYGGRKAIAAEARRRIEAAGEAARPAV